MNTNEFNDAVAGIVRQCASRNTTFAEEHLCIHGPQPFEDKDVHDTVNEALEEVLDLINYSVMITLKLKKLQREFA